MTPMHSSKAKELQADASFLDAVDTPLLELHKSNILKLEVDELLEECRLDIQNVSWASHVRDYVGLLTNVLKKLPDTPVKKDDCPFVLQSQKVTLVEIPKDLKLVPTGSYAINALTKKAGNANVVPTLDCAVVVKDSYWQQKDYLNHRYMDVSAPTAACCLHMIQECYACMHSSCLRNVCTHPITPITLTCRNEMLFFGP